MARLLPRLLLLFNIKAQKNEAGNVGWYNPDSSPSQEKDKLIALCKELNVDIKYKIHMTDAIRDSMEKDHKFLFHVGTTLGAMREYYKTQLELYRQMRDKFGSRNSLNTPEYRKGVVGVHFVVAMEEIYAKEVTIENHLLALLKIPQYMFDNQAANSPEGILDIEAGDGAFKVRPESLHEYWEAERPYQKTSPKPSVVSPPGMQYSPPKRPDTRSGPNDEGAAKGMTEDELKRKMRAQYYQKHKN